MKTQASVKPSKIRQNPTIIQLTKELNEEFSEYLRSGNFSSKLNKQIIALIEGSCYFVRYASKKLISKQFSQCDIDEIFDDIYYNIAKVVSDKKKCQEFIDNSNGRGIVPLLRSIIHYRTMDVFKKIQKRKNIDAMLFESMKQKLLEEGIEGIEGIEDYE